MAEAKDIPPGDYELRLGATFSQKRDPPTYHTLRYDFKPQSVAASDSESYIAFGGNGVQVAVPTGDDGLTVYKGAQKPVKADKECLLFFDHRTGTVRLEKLNSNINVKKTRDNDPSTEQVLRAKIADLRTSSSRPAPASSQAQGGSSSPLPHMDDSSSASSESSSDSESDSRSNKGRNSDSSAAEDSDVDDEQLRKQLESEMTGVDAGPSVSARPPPPPTRAPLDSMPSFDGLDDQTSRKPAQISKSFSTQKREKDLMNDLQLSESSEDED